MNPYQFSPPQNKDPSEYNEYNKAEVQQEYDIRQKYDIA